MTVSKTFFKQVIQKDLPVILGEEETPKALMEFERLISAVPRMPPAPGDHEQNVRILYQKLYNELRVRTFKTFLIIGPRPAATAYQPTVLPSRVRDGKARDSDDGLAGAGANEAGRSGCDL